MESIVFANSPLAEYLEGNGQNEADWGIEAHDSNVIAPDSSNLQFAPTLSTTARSPTNVIKDLKPLLLGHTGSWRNSPLYQAIYRIIDGRLSRNENARFLERFRYIIIASQLLNGHVNVSHYDCKAKTEQLFPEQDIGAIGGVQYGGTQCWIGSGGFVLATSLLLPWVFRGGGRTGMSKGKIVIALVLSVGVGLFLFVHARQRWLRSLRLRTVQLATVFVQNSQMFDILASNAVTLIQEVELVSRGYRLSTPLPPISRLERDSQSRRCSKLRKSIWSALRLAIPPHKDACTSLRSFVHDNDLEQYYDMYDIQTADLEEARLGMDNEQFDDEESLKTLKTLLHRLHTTRRVFLCHLLALGAEGSSADYSKWKLVAEQIQSLGRMTGELAGEVKDKLGEEEQIALPPSPRSPISPGNERHRGQLRKLNSLSQALRGLQAKMHVLREESDRNLQESSDEMVEFGEDLLAHYDSIGADLHALVNEWESGRSYLAMNLDRQSMPTTPSAAAESISGTTLVGDTPRNSGAFDKNDWADVAGMGHMSPTTEKENFEEETVFEAVAEPRPRSTMTREERIRRVQDERAQAAEKRKKADAGLALQKELQAVLVNRPPMQRRSTYRSFSR